MSSALSFREKLEARVEAIESLLCVGLDPHKNELFPAASATPPDEQSWEDISEEKRCQAAYEFCQKLVEATLPYTACYKPNAAFFEALGDNGPSVLRRVCRELIPDDVPVLLDVKRGDIGSTAAAYAEACYDHIGADAVTLSPLMGWDSVSPFLSGAYETKGAFLLCKTSNPGSNDLLALSLGKGELLYERIGHIVGCEWAKKTNAALGLVVGATDPVALRKARASAGEDTWILAPGVGAQGGNLKEAAEAGMNRSGTKMLIPVSRGISKAEDPAVAAKTLKEQIWATRLEILAGSTEMKSDKIEPYQREFLDFALKEGVLKFGTFVLKSGRTSPYFFNAGLFASGAALFKLGKAYARSIMASPELCDGSGEVKFDVIFGPAYKGISLGAVVSSALYSDFGVNVGFAYNRKEAKDHGEGGKLVGASMKDKRVLVIDDVITAGTAIRESFDMLTAVGALPVGVSIALDRAEIRSLDDKISAVQAVVRDLQMPVVSIVNLPQLEAFLQGHPDFDDDMRQSVSVYRKEYGV